MPVGDLEQDTAIEEAGPGRYRATISPDWALWRPVGGYAAAIALRAAGAHSAMPLPVSLSCQYLAPVRFETVDIDVACLRSSRRAELLTVTMSQRGSPVLCAHVWTFAAELTGPGRPLSKVPEVPPPDQVPEIVPTRSTTPTGTFWRNIEVRSVPPEAGCPAAEFVARSWVKFRPRAYFRDPWVDACREVIAIDTAIFPAAAVAMADGRYAGFSIDLYVAFHTPSPAEDYLLVTARGTAAGGGLVSGTAQTWSAGGTLTASGASQLMCRMIRSDARLR